MLTKNQFALLSYIAARPAGEPALSQRAIAQGTGKALGTVNGLVKELSAMGCLDGANRITDAGLAALAPYRVDNAVIMAAGMGSRYGGSKQVDGIGPDGEILMEYSIYDAIRAGFTKVVFIIKPEMRELVETLCGRRVAGMTAADGSPVEVCYAYQDFSSVPAFYSIPAERTKPFGTGHAVLCARSCVGEPFIVINADDYYGVDAFRVIYEELGRLKAEGEATMVGYRLDKTVSEHGSVTRGVCHVTDGTLDRVVETFKLTVFPDGTIRDVDKNPEGDVYAPDTPVSMNFWGFTPWIFTKLEEYFNAFLRALPTGELKKECLLPSMVGELIEKGQLRVSVLYSDAKWFGMTYHEDKDAVAAALKALHDAGVYPPTLHG